MGTASPGRPWPESYCILLYGNSLIKAGSHTVELFSDFARNLCRYCTSDFMCVTFRQVAGITHDLLTRIIKSPLLEPF